MRLLVEQYFPLARSHAIGVIARDAGTPWKPKGAGLSFFVPLNEDSNGCTPHQSCLRSLLPGIKVHFYPG